MTAPRVVSILTDRANLLRRVADLLLLVGVIATVASLFVPWWSLHSSAVNGQQALFDFAIGPLGMSIRTPVGDPGTLLAGFRVVYWIATIALLPVSVSLGLAAFHGVYCLARRRRGARTLIAPLWGVIGLFWWAFYFLLVYGFFGTLGLDISPTGSADVSWQGYQLVGATWGWDTGLWLGIAGTGVLFAGAALSSRRARSPLPEGTRPAFGFHSVGLFLLALGNLGAMALLLVSLQRPGIAWLVLVPVLLLVAMAFLARTPKAAGAPRAPFPAVPKVPNLALKIPEMPGRDLWPGRVREPVAGPPPPPRNGTAAPLLAGPTLAPAAREFPCPSCGARFPTQVQLDAHRLTHAVGTPIADARRTVDDLGKRLFRRP